MDHLKSEISAIAARWVVEDGFQYGRAKRRALKQLGVSARTALPGNDELEEAVAAHIALFCSQTQACELLALRRLALQWMERMSSFRPYLSGAVWRGVTTHSSDICIELFCDDCKSAEIWLIDHQLPYIPKTVVGLNGAQVEALSMRVACPELNQVVGVDLLIYEYDDIRGALRTGAKERAPRGDLTAVRHLLRDQTP